MAFSVGERELFGVNTTPLIGHMAAWNYFHSIKSPENEAFVKNVGGLHRATRQDDK